MEKYRCGDMFSKPNSGLFNPTFEENGSETKGQLFLKGNFGKVYYLVTLYSYLTILHAVSDYKKR